MMTFRSIARFAMASMLALSLGALGALAQDPGGRIAGPRGMTGPQGPQGIPGATWLTGSGAPSSGIGVNGDWYFRSDTAQIYTKSAGAWSAVFNLPSGSANGAASMPAWPLTGTWFTGGTSTTTKPHFLVEPAGTTSTGWSTAGTGIGVNAPSGFLGNLIDLQVNGQSKLQYAANVDAFKTAYAAGWGAQLRYLGISTRSTGYLGWAATNSADGTIDTSLFRDAANVVAQRNGTAGQAFRIYNTYTDASNYERTDFGYSGNVFTIGTTGAGTGSSRLLRLAGGSTFLEIDPTSGAISMKRDGTSSNTLLQLNSSGLVGTAIQYMRIAPSINQASGSYGMLDINPTETSIGAGPHYLIRAGVGGSGNLWGLRNNGAMDMAEIADPSAPSANRGLVYMRDNGGGKTQLVARFPTGAIQVIATEP